MECFGSLTGNVYHAFLLQIISVEDVLRVDDIQMIKLR